jgi:hypothetical protein
MDNKIFHNSYVVMIITFIVLCVGFYLFGIGTDTVIENGVPKKKFSWKYPLAISLVVWVIWHFYVYPPPEEIVTDQTAMVAKPMIDYNGSKENFIIPERMLPKRGELGVGEQKINMINWY